MDSRKPPQPSPTLFQKKTAEMHSQSGAPAYMPGVQYFGDAAISAGANAKSYATAAVPIATFGGLLFFAIGVSEHNPFPRWMTGPFTLAAIIFDTVKAVICLPIAGEEAARSGVASLLSLLFERKDKDNAAKEIYGSFLLRMEHTINLLICLGLETHESIQDKLRRLDIEELVGLTLLHTAFDSRHQDNGLLLANNKVLTEAACPDYGRVLFKSVTKLTRLINEGLALATFDPTIDRNQEEARVVCDWIRAIKNKLATGVVLEDKPDATTRQLSAVNEIIGKIQEATKQGMMILPESTELVVSHFAKPTM